jgi:hypothetical protein
VLLHGARVHGRVVLAWDRRTAQGDAVALGVYWLRLALPSGAYVLTPGVLL